MKIGLGVTYQYFAQSTAYLYAILQRELREGKKATNNRLLVAFFVRGMRLELTHFLRY